MLDLIAGQARLRYELDDKTIAKAEINLGQPMTLKSPNIAARDALADVLGGIGLSYRVTEEGQALHHDGGPAGRRHRQEGRRDRGAAGEAGDVAAAARRPTRPTAR